MDQQTSFWKSVILCSFPKNSSTITDGGIFVGNAKLWVWLNFTFTTLWEFNPFVSFTFLTNKGLKAVRPNVSHASHIPCIPWIPCRKTCCSESFHWIVTVYHEQTNRECEREEQSKTYSVPPDLNIWCQFITNMECVGATVITATTVKYGRTREIFTNVWVETHLLGAGSRT